MPDREINLLPEETFFKRTRERSRQKSIFRLTLLMAFVTALLIFGAFSYSLYITNQAAQVKKKAELERKKIEQMRNREILLLWTKTKVLAIQKVLSSRSLYEVQLKALDSVAGLFTEGLTLSKYSFAGNKADFTVSAANSTLIEEFVNNLLQENEQQSLFKSITIKSLNLEEGGGYKLTFATILSD